MFHPTGHQLRRGRILRGISQARLAEILGCHRSTIGRNEQKKISKVSPRMRQLLSTNPAGRFWVGVDRGRRDFQREQIRRGTT